METESIKQIRTEEELQREALAALDARDYKKAVQLFRNLLKVRPRYPVYYLMTSYCYGLLKDFKNTDKYLEKSLARVSKRSINYDFDKMADELSTLLLEKNPSLKPYEALKLLVESKRKLGKHKPSEEELAFEKVLVERFYNLEKAITNSDAPNSIKYRQAFIKIALWAVKLGLDSQMLGFDDDGVFVVTNEELIRRKAKYPGRQYILSTVIKNAETGEEQVLTFNARKQFKMGLPTESELKTRIRKRRYYYKHQMERQDHQKRYDRRNKIRKHFRNRLDYMLKRGTVHAYRSERQYEDILK